MEELDSGISTLSTKQYLLSKDGVLCRITTHWFTIFTRQNIFQDAHLWKQKWGQILHLFGEAF